MQAGDRAPSSGGRTSGGAPCPGTSRTHSPAGMAGDPNGRAQPGPGRPPGRARSAQLGERSSVRSTERSAPPGSTFRCGEASATLQTPATAREPRLEALQAVQGCSRARRKLVRRAGRPRRPSTAATRPQAGGSAGAPQQTCPTNFGTLPNFGQSGLGHPRVTKNVDGFDPARTPAPWGPSAVCEKRGAEG